MKRIAAIAAVALAGLVLWLGPPSIDKRAAREAPRLDAELRSRAWHIDPAELLDLMHNNQVRLAVLDVRDEAEYNLFHLVSARLWSGDADDLRWVRALPDASVKVLVDNDEARADEAWKRLTVAAVPNVYILAGGINGWLELVARYTPPPARNFTVTAATADGRGYTFEAALGARHGAALPPADLFADRAYEKKVKVRAPAATTAGGCGG